MFGLIKLSDDEKVIIAQALAFSHYTFERRGNDRQAQRQLRANAQLAEKLGIDIPTLKQGKPNNAYRCAMARYAPTVENTDTQKEPQGNDQ